MRFWRSRWFWFPLVLVLLLLVTWMGWNWFAPWPVEVTFPSPQVPQLDQYVYPLYEMDLVLNPQGQTLVGTSRLTYTNNEDEDLSELYFHLYPQAPLFTEGVRSPGGLEVEEVLVDGFPGVWREDKTLLQVKLAEPLSPGEEVQVEIPFTLTIPSLGERLGIREGIITLGNWYPILAVYEGEWHLDPYYQIGDPFYSDIALYRVNLELPRRYSAAGTGNLVAVEGRPGFRKRLAFETGPVRDFALAVSSNYQLAVEEVDGITVQSFYLRGSKEEGQVALAAAREALELFQELFGPYPYDQLSVAASGFFAGGMEYPNLVFISQDLYREGAEQLLEYVVVHEVAHQWWYGLVGNDQIREPWLDEGLADFSTHLFFEKRRPEVNDPVPGSLQDLYLLHRDEMGDGIIHRPLWEFSSNLEYSLLVYGKGSMVFGELRELLGDEVFFAFLQEYVRQFKYRHATIEDFIHLCQEFSGMDLGKFFYRWLETA